MRPDQGRGSFSPDNGHEVLLSEFTQPLTTKQLAVRLRIDSKRCNHHVRTLAATGLISCLNPLARRSRVYWLTPAGMRRRNSLVPSQATHPASLSTSVDWALYGWICFSHRSAVLRALEPPLNAASVKRAARFRDPALRMSANNVRDVLRAFLDRGLVRIQPSTSPRSVYELTERGNVLRLALLRAETRLHNDLSRTRNPNQTEAHNTREATPAHDETTPEGQLHREP